MSCFVFIFKKKNKILVGLLKMSKAFLLKSPNVENDCRVPVTANQFNVAL